MKKDSASDKSVHKSVNKSANKPVTAAAFSNSSGRNRVIELLDEVGLLRAPRCYRDYRFIMALLAGALVLWLIHDMLPPFSASMTFHWQLWLSLVIWQPIIEEFLFRGILQGQLKKTAWGKNARLQISAANLVTSLLFVGLHLLNNPPLFALSVFVPSLLFGYFRDRCNNIYPSIVLHAAFNALVIEGLFLHGNINMMKIIS